MDYNIIICSSSKLWAAVDVNDAGECDRISFDGNEVRNIENNDDVEKFCDDILDYYNIEKVEDINLNIKIVITRCSGLIEKLYEGVKNATNVNIIDIKNIIPIYVLKNCLVKANSVIGIECLDDIYSVEVDDNLYVTVSNDKVEHIINISPENFSLLFSFDCSNLISDEKEKNEIEAKSKKEIDKLKKEINMQKKALDDKQKAYEKLVKKYENLQKSIEDEKDTLADKRIVLWFSKDDLKNDNVGIIRTIEIINSMHSVLDNNANYSCKLLKKDGDVITKGTQLVEIKENFTASDGAVIETHKQAIIKATSTGRIFYLVKDGDKLKGDTAVAILTDSSDTKMAVMKWYKNMK